MSLHLSMSKKIFGVVGLLVLVAAIIALVGVASIGRMNDDIYALGTQAERSVQLYAMNLATQKRSAAMFRAIINTDDARIEKILKADYEPTMGEFAEALETYTRNIPANADSEAKGRPAQLKAAWEAYAKDTEEIVSLAKINSRAKAIEEVNKSMERNGNIDKGLEELFKSVPYDSPADVLRLRDEIASARTAFAYYRIGARSLIAADTPERIQSALESIKTNMETSIAHLKEAGKIPGDPGKKARDLAASLEGDCVASMNEIIRLGERDTSAEAVQYFVDHGEASMEAIHKLSQEFINIANAGRDAVRADAIRTGYQANLSATMVAVIGILASVILAFFTITNITKHLNQIITELGKASTQVADAAAMISSTSHHLAEGATEQAASLEETSASLEEMSSMPRRNADNAGVTATTTTHELQLIDEGAKAVQNMSSSMHEISDSAKQISHIIKTIEEISFQTNLLALNAAVEAARAGDAGKGFAVVADEVRNLAQRAAQAARDTSELIESTVTRVHSGEEVAEHLDSSFRQIETEAREVGKLIGEITSASSEQAQGVDQINIAVERMDKVTQATAANAEESASASEELSAQAASLQTVVETLVSLVTGQAAVHAARPAAPPRPGPADPPRQVAAQVKEPPAKPKEALPPGDDEDFKDF